MCNHHKKDSFASNAQDWIVVAVPYVIGVNLVPLEDPMLILLFGAAIGAMGMWAQDILSHWIKAKVKEEDLFFEEYVKKLDK